MTNEEFEGLWQQIEAREHGRRMMEGYASWRRRRKWAATGVAMCLVAVVAFLPLQMQHPGGYDKIYCNRPEIPDAHWVDVAAEMLTMDIV